MRREIDELFGDVFGKPALAPHRRGGFTPTVDVSYADDPPRAIVTAALPGVALSDLGIEVQGRQLVIAGYRRPAQAEGRVYQQIEIEHGAFRRVVALGADVDAERTAASLKDGLLSIELPLAAPAQPRSVPISTPGQEVLRAPGGGDGA